MEKNILIYHHNDLDGYAAAAAVCYGMKRNAAKDVDLNFEFRAISFPTTWETFENDETEPREFQDIVIVDYSFTTNNVGILKDLVEYVNYTADHVYWIDHHVTSVAAEENLPKYDKFKFTSYVNTNRSGAWLAYEYFCDLNDEDIYNERIPEVIRLVDDYDRWVHLDPSSELLNNAFFVSEELHNPASVEWFKLLDADPDAGMLFDQLITEGKAIAKYREALYAQHQKFAYEVKIKGFEEFSAVALNDRGNSKCFGNLVKQYDICILFHTNMPGYVAMSLYCDPEILKAKNIDVSKIALKYGGGGHPGAAGCSMTVEQFGEVFTPVNNTELN